jgi:DNA-binding GntR family transcriptional regulator
LLTTNIISFSYQVLHTEGLVRAPNETIQEHLAVIEAIKGRDPEAAEDLMRQHFKKSLTYLKREINGEGKR